MRLSLSLSVLVATLSATTTTLAFAPRYASTTSSSRLSTTDASSTFALYSTLAPTSSQFTGFDDDDDDENDKKNKIPSTTSSPNQQQRLGGISLSITDLIQTLGFSQTTAQLVWDCYSIGIDPANFYAPTIHLGYDDYESIYTRLPSERRHLQLQPCELSQLASLYDASPAGQRQVEGGVATLSYISQGMSSTKILLKMVDGTKVETIISTSKGQDTSSVSIATMSKQDKDNTPSQRFLSSDELLAQVFFAQKLCRLEGLPELTELVLPADYKKDPNVMAVQQAMQIVSSPNLFPQLTTIHVGEASLL